MHITATISTKNRYHTTLPSCLIAIINQTRKPDHLIVFDDGDKINPTEDPTYKTIFTLAMTKGITWEWVYASQRGQHWNHEEAQRRAKEWVWRVDDDCMAEGDCLEQLSCHVADNVGIVCGPVIVPPSEPLKGRPVSLTIDTLSSLPNIQWFIPDETSSVIEIEHAHCSFLYRAKIVKYCTDLSPVAHREETLFSYEMFRRGYKIIYTPRAIKWHLRAPSGGIRSGQSQACFEGDEFTFQKRLPILKEHGKYRVCYLRDAGIGDHFCFKPVLEQLIAGGYYVIVGASHPWVFGDVDGRDRLKIISVDECKRTFIYDDKHHSVYIKTAESGCDIETGYRNLYL